MKRFITGLALAVTLTGCGISSGAAGQAAHIDRVTLADDGRSLHVDFIGGREFDPNDPCSIAYQASARVVDDELEIGVYPQKHPMPLPSGTACDMAGHTRTISLALETPFAGIVVHDLSGQRLLLGPPPALAEIGALAVGWELRREESLGGSLTPRWRRIWSPGPDPWPSQGDSMVTLIQAFGGPVETGGGDQVSSVEVNGQPARLSENAPSGELLLVWSLGEDELALVGNLRYFRPDAFISLAESVVIPTD